VLMALLVAIWREWLREVELMDEIPPVADAPSQIEAAAEPRKIQAG
ncbi:MAG: AI-2E family transporter, partial [Mesorhizobium sp.]